MLEKTSLGSFSALKPKKDFIFVELPSLRIVAVDDVSKRSVFVRPNEYVELVTIDSFCSRNIAIWCPHLCFPFASIWIFPFTNRSHTIFYTDRNILELSF